jgi:hypothetical protein
MPDIEIKPIEQNGETLRFSVKVSEGGSSSSHEVTLSRSDHQRLAADESPEDFVVRCFRFLLEREPKESILSSFDITAIGRYFPEFEEEIRR